MAVWSIDHSDRSGPDRMGFIAWAEIDSPGMIYTHVKQHCDAADLKVLCSEIRHGGGSRAKT